MEKCTLANFEKNTHWHILRNTHWHILIKIKIIYILAHDDIGVIAIKSMDNNTVSIKRTENNAVKGRINSTYYTY